jgi:hypothetical protein
MQKYIIMGKYTKEGLNIYFTREERYKLADTEEASISIKDTILNKVKRLKSLEAFGTADIYINAYLSFSNYRDDALRFEDITVSWLNGYEKYMITQGKSYTTNGLRLSSPL